MPNPVTHERIWRDKEVLMKRTEKRYIEMCVDGSGKAFRLGTAANLLDAMEEVREKTIPGFNIPFCLIHGDMDAGVPVDGSDYMWYVDVAVQFTKNLVLSRRPLTRTSLRATVDTPMADRVYHRVEGGYHDMLSDPFAEEAMEHCVAFINDRVSK